MPESEIYYHLSRKLGMRIDSSKLPEPGNENIEHWLDERIKGFSALTLNDLKNGPVLAPGLQEIAFSDMRFNTPSGKIELCSGEAEIKWGISPVPVFIQDSEKSVNKKYPLAFITPNTAGRIHSQFGNLDVIIKTLEKPSVLFSPADAKERGISSGDKIRIFNSHGELYSKAEISNRIPVGIIVLPNGIWLNEGGGGNLLVASRHTDIGFGAAFHDTYAEAEKAE